MISFVATDGKWPLDEIDELVACRDAVVVVQVLPESD